MRYKLFKNLFKNNFKINLFYQLYSRNKEDEIEFLKESLKNIKSDLERERLLNAAIKQKKVFLEQSFKNNIF